MANSLNKKFPKSTTSRLQPLDAGIIKNFKVHYCKVLFTHVLAKINNSNGVICTATEITKSVDVLTAIEQTNIAWDAVKPVTIINCFRHCGVRAEEVVNVEEEELEEDPFADLDELLKQAEGDDFVTAEEYIDAEEGLAACHTWEEHENWREELREIALEEEHVPKRAELEDSHEDTTIEEEMTPKCVVETYDEALECALFLLAFTNKEAVKIN